MRDKLHHVMIGLPEAGKTTYLAALWHVLCSNEVDGSLTLARLEGDQTYLNQIREAWARASTIGRTNPGKEPNLCFLLKDEAGNELAIRVPDLSGEAFEADWVDRTMEKERAEILSDVSGAMLFINPQNVRSEVLISAVADDATELEDDDEPGDEGSTDTQQTEDTDQNGDGADGPGDSTEWRAELAPTQIQLVDLLQIVLRLNERRPLFLVVVVSAWDEIKQNIKPENWVKRELPLLWQFLTSNPNDLKSTYLGISAQGGDLEKDGDRLKGIDIPSERISVVPMTDGISHDITRPLRWLMMQTNQ
jgi:hypothetical protein